MPASTAPVTPRFIQPRVSGSARVNVGAVERVASALGGAALAAYGFSRGSVGGVLLGALGAGLVVRGATGYCGLYDLMDVSTADSEKATPAAVEITETVTVASAPEVAYDFWRRLENLPRFMHHLASVNEMGDGRSLWTARSPGPLPDFSWEAQILQDEPGRLLVWQSVEGSDVENAGHVEFRPAPRGGTEVHVRIAYRPPAGDVGHVVAKALGPVFEDMVRDDIRRFRDVLETGNAPGTA